METQVFENVDSYLIRYMDGSSDLYVDWLGDDVVFLDIDFQYIPRMGHA